MRTVEVTLGDQEYKIQELPTRKNESWRKQLESQLSPIIDVIDEVNREKISLDNAHTLAPAAQQVLQIAMRSPTEIRDLVLAYSPALKSREDEILEEAYDSEFMDAFLKVLGLAYPFGGILPAIQRLTANGDLAGETPGLETPATSQS